MAKVTKRCVDNAGVKSERYIVWDSELKGFGLLILPSGVKSYFFQYRTPEGRQRRTTIGKHGAWTPDQARRKAEELRQLVRAGRDPLGERRLLLEAPTVSEILDAYLLSESFKEKAASTRVVDRGRIERHLRPLLGRRHAHLLTPDEIKRAHSAIKEGKTAANLRTRSRGLARVRGGPGAARMAIDLLRVACGWAVRERMLKSNPCSGIRTGTSGTRETILENAEEYARLFQTLDKMESEKRIRTPVADAIRLIALTGCRRGEAAALKWSQVDLRQGRITLPANSHKTGRKTGKPRIIVLPTAAQAIIAKQPAGEPEDFVFIPARGKGAPALSKAWRQVRKEACLPVGIGLHGLRHSLASHMAMTGAQASEIMTALGHSQLSTSQRYIHWAQTARKNLAERAAAIPLEGLAKSVFANDADIIELKGNRR